MRDPRPTTPNTRAWRQPTAFDLAYSVRQVPGTNTWAPYWSPWIGQGPGMGPAVAAGRKGRPDGRPPPPPRRPGYIDDSWEPTRSYAGPPTHAAVMRWMVKQGYQAQIKQWAKERKQMQQDHIRWAQAHGYAGMPYGQRTYTPGRWVSAGQGKAQWQPFKSAPYKPPVVKDTTEALEKDPKKRWWLLRAYSKWQAGKPLTTRERLALRGAWAWIQQRRAAWLASQGVAAAPEPPPPADAGGDVAEVGEDLVAAAAVAPATGGPNWLLIGGVVAVAAAVYYLFIRK